MRAEYDQLTDEIHELKGGVPSAPFIMDTNQWVALSLKRMVRWAADNKFDKIGWTTGSQQADRYNLRKYIQFINAEKIPGRRGDFERPNSQGYLKPQWKLEIGSHADEHANRKMDTVYLNRNELADYVGKEMAAKIEENNGGMFKDLDLEIGGEGMKGFYDKIVNDQAKALGKKYGAKVETSDIGSAHSLRPVTDGRQWRIYDPIFEDYWTNPETRQIPVFKSIEDAAATIKEKAKGIPVSTLNLTPKLRDAARKGLPYMVVLPPVVIGSQMMQEEAPVPEAQVEVPAAQVRASRILEEAVP